MVTYYRSFIRWKRRSIEMLRARHLVYPVVCWGHQGVFKGL
jgi:hypothetical protein